MTEQIFTTSNITFVVGIIGIIIGVYKSINKPQVDLEKNQAINEEKDKSKATVLQQKETENKAILLAEQVKWDKESNAQKFAEMGIRIDRAFEVAQNHINTIETEVKNLTVSVGVMTNKITELNTILIERLPPNKNK